MLLDYKPSEFDFIFREDFDYRSYLEAKSHFDRIESKIDSGLRKLVVSNDQLSRDLSLEAAELNTTTRDGFETIAYSLKDLTASVNSLKTTMEDGFDRIDAKLSDIDNSIQELLAVAKSPDQTWALEQYSIAVDAYKRKLWDEALEYVNRSIDGFKNKSGYPLEYRFHELRGNLRLGNYSNTSAAIVDPELATTAFENAAKYVNEGDKTTKSVLLGRAAWAAYCSGDTDTALAHYKISIEYNSSNELSLFEISKVLFHIGELDEGKTLFTEAIRKNWKYALRAARDPDFLLHSEATEQAINSLRQEYFARLKELGKWASKIDLLSYKPLLQPYTNPVPESIFADFQLIQSMNELPSLGFSAPLVKSTRNHKQTVFEGAQNAITHSQRYSRALASTGLKPVKEFTWQATTGGLIVFALILTFTWSWAMSVHWLLALVAVPIAGFFGACIGIAIAPLFATIASIANWLLGVANRKTQIDFAEQEREQLRKLLAAIEIAN